jgi:hypothetical protein
MMLYLPNQLTGYGNQASHEEVRQFAAEQFWQVRLNGVVRQVLSLLTGRRARPADLHEEAQKVNIVSRRYVGVRPVPLAEITGSEGRSLNFDASFRPVAGHLSDRWIGIATVMLRGAALPPVDLVQMGGRYFVRDGNHRVSVARYLGQQEIDAQVTVWETA